MKPNRFKEDGSDPDYATLKDIVSDYRSFVGETAAFHIEYVWWPGQFETKDEEIDFMLDERSEPPDYEVLDEWYDEAIEQLAASEVNLVDARSSRNFWRAVSIFLAFPYFVLLYFWRT